MSLVLNTLVNADPTFILSIQNFMENSAEEREKVAAFMGHSIKTQERFYALHKNVATAKSMRSLFVCGAVRGS